MEETTGRSAKPRRIGFDSGLNTKEGADGDVIWAHCHMSLLLQSFCRSDRSSECIQVRRCRSSSGFHQRITRFMTVSTLQHRQYVFH